MSLLFFKFCIQPSVLVICSTLKAKKDFQHIEINILVSWVKIDDWSDKFTYFFYIYFNPWGARKGVHLANHNLISVRLRKYWLIILEYCTFLTSACSFNIGLALLLGIRSLDPRPRARTAPALAWCRRQLGSQTSCSAKSRSQFWSLTFNDKHWNVWWNLAS